MKNRNPNVDLCRFIAANLVVLCHVVYIEWGGVGHLGRLRPLGDLGYLGVDVFFAISSYVISLSAVDCQAKDFLIARFIRLFPGLFLAALIAALCMRSEHAPVHTNIFGDISSLFLLNTATGTQSSNPVFWTLAYEFKFYIMISILLLLHKNTLLNIRTAAIFWLFIYSYPLSRWDFRVNFYSGLRSVFYIWNSVEWDKIAKRAISKYTYLVGNFNFGYKQSNSRMENSPCLSTTMAFCDTYRIESIITYCAFCCCRIRPTS
jgi:peptidoglycan/LPS O-acetylase OafA/YrhL